VKKALTQKIKLFLKTSVGLVLVFWVLKGKMIDFSVLRHLILNPFNLLAALGFLTASALLCTARWLILVRSQGLFLSFKDLFSLTMIGNFFNTFMPGSVGGDLIKAWYMAGKEPQNRTKAVFTVLLDRVIGLSVIIFYAAGTLILFSKWLDVHPEMHAIAVTLWSFTLAFALSYSLFFFKSFWKTRFSQVFLSFFTRSPKFSKLIEAAFVYQKHGKQLMGAFGLSALSILITIYFHFVQGNLIQAPLDLKQYFVIVPLAATVSAVPLLPGGLGTGQIVFFTLFKWMGVENPELGGTLCTLLQVYTILFNCLGYFFYLRYKRVPASFAQSKLSQ